MLPVIFITGHGDVPMAVHAMKHGAFDFLQKPFRDQDLIDRIHRALQLDATIVRIWRCAQRSRIEWPLTPREKQVMDLMIGGKPNKVMAIDLGLSQRTVEIHRAQRHGKNGCAFGGAPGQDAYDVNGKVLAPRRAGNRRTASL